MLDLSLVNNNVKMAVGIIALILCFAVYFMTPDYVEFYLIFIFLIPAIALIVPKDSIRNLNLLGILTLIFVIFAAYFAIKGMFGAYDILTDLYVSGKLTTLPVTADVDACYMAYLYVLLNALFNIITAAMFFIPTAEDNF